MIYGADGYGGDMWGGDVAVVQRPLTLGDIFQNDAWDAEESVGPEVWQDIAASTGSDAYAPNGSLNTRQRSVRQMLRQGFTVSMSATPGGEPLNVFLGIDPYAYYTIEVVTVEGESLGKVTTWNSGDYSADIGESGRLSFRVPRSEPLLSQLTFPNLLVLRDRYGFVLDRFRAARASEYNDGDGLFVDMRARSIIDQLAREPVIDYSKEDTVINHLRKLLENQLQTPAISLGAVDEAIGAYTVAVECEVSNVLSLLCAIQAQLPVELSGHFYVSSNFELRWRKIIGETDRRFVMGKNLVGVRKSIDDEELVTRLYMYGEGQDGEKRPSYVASRNEEVYGIRPLVKVDRRIRKMETLTARAEALIEQFCVPKVSIEINALDLAKADIDKYYELGDYYVGGKYRVEDPAQGLSELITVIGIRYNLSNPVAVQIKSANRFQSLANVLGEARADIPTSTNVNSGDNWENIARLYDGTELDEPVADRFNELEYRNGDLMYGDDVLQYFQEDRGWVSLTPTYVVDTDGDLPTTNIPENALARVRSDGSLKKRNTADDGWENVGGGGGGNAFWVTGDSYPELPDVNEQEATTMAKVLDGPQKDQIYKVGEIDGTPAWVCVSEYYEAASKGALTNNAYVQRFAVGRVGDIYYRRNTPNNGWFAMNVCE